MSKLRPGKLIQVINGRWYTCKNVEIQRCCNCGLDHKVHLKIKDNKIMAKWQVVK